MVVISLRVLHNSASLTLNFDEPINDGLNLMEKPKDYSTVSSRLQTLHKAL